MAVRRPARDASSQRLQVCRSDFQFVERSEMLSTVRSPVPVERLPIRIGADDDLVITLPFLHGGEARVRSIFHRVSNMSDEEVDSLLGEVLSRFEHRHLDFAKVLEEHYDMAAGMVNERDPISEKRRKLLGSYFTLEYSLAAAALFNPSIVPHPNQNGVADGDVRFVMSLRATGEGHISSIVFRTGLIHADRSVEFYPPGAFPRRARLSPDQFFVKALFSRKLREMAIDPLAVELVMRLLPERFTLGELERALSETKSDAIKSVGAEHTIEGIRWLAHENYQLRLPDDAHISQIVIFPRSDTERRGIEDLRMVRFTEEDGSAIYYGTYTAYDGYRTLPQLIDTSDLYHLNIHTLNGACVQNKGMALFPRRVNGQFVMCSRIDGVNLHIMYSDNVFFWETAQLMRTPKHPWEFMQIGNCGSPIETPVGWLLLTHGVGPMRTYSIGAMLLDLDDPLKVIGHLDEPLLMPLEEEREGYVPNVVYTCGAMVHGDYLYLPYAMSDAATGFALVELEKLLSRLCP